MLLFEGSLLRRPVGNLRVAREGPVARVGVGQHERVAARFMLVEIVDARPLHQAVHEIEVGLVVLHAEVERLIAAHKPRDVVVGKAEVVKDLLEDVDDRLVLEDAAV